VWDMVCLAGIGAVEFGRKVAWAVAAEAPALPLLTVEQIAGRAKEEGCYMGRSRSYAATEPSHGRIQPVREGEPSGQTPPLKGCIARSACSQSLMETVVH
jgi:hypothetical protein